MTKSTKAKSELAVTVARNAGALIEELTEQGQNQAGMKQMFGTCVDARMIVEAMSWRLHDMTDEKRERTVQALRMVADYVQDTKNPQANAEEVWVVETMVLRILDQFNNYVTYESQHYRNPLNLTGFVSFIIGAAGTIAAFIEKGYDRVATTSEKKLYKEWRQRPTKKSDELPARGVFTNPWSESDVYRLADEAREKATAEDKKPCAR
jgi:hypothetical protein